MSLFLGNSNKSSLDAHASCLSILLKYHKSAEAIVLPHESYKSMVREEASQQGFNTDNVEVREGEDYSCKPVHLVITNTVDAQTKSEFLTALEQIKFTQFDLKVINLSGKGKGLAFFFKTYYTRCFGHVNCLLFKMKQFQISHGFEHYNFVFVSVTRFYKDYSVLVPIPVGEPHFNKSA